MKLLLFVSLLAAAYAHGDCGGDCLKACTSCGPLDNEGAEPEDGSSVFKYGSRYERDCLTAICADNSSVMIVDGHAYNRVVCFQGKWHFGYPDFLEETSSAMCLSPGNQTCDVDATLGYDGEFKCQCKPNFQDVSEDFDLDEPVCSSCVNRRINITFLIDNSGSMFSVLDTIKNFIYPLVQFMKVNATGNTIAVVTSSYSYDILVDWTPDSYSDSVIRAKVASVVAGGQSYLATGMEAVKAELVQPSSNTTVHKLIVFTDGSVKHSPPAVRDITVAANNLEALKVETFVVSTNVDNTTRIGRENRRRLVAIANGVENNIFTITDDEDENFDIVNKLQKRICA